MLDKDIKEVRKADVHMKGNRVPDKVADARPGAGTVLGFLKRQHKPSLGHCHEFEKMRVSMWINKGVEHSDGTNLLESEGNVSWACRCRTNSKTWWLKPRE